MMGVFKIPTMEAFPMFRWFAIVIHLGQIAWRELTRPHGALARGKSFVGIKTLGFGIFVAILRVFIPLRKSGSAEGNQEQNWREPSKHGKGLHRRDLKDPHHKLSLHQIQTPRALGVISPPVTENGSSRRFTHTTGGI